MIVYVECDKKLSNSLMMNSVWTKHSFSRAFIIEQKNMVLRNSTFNHHYLFVPEGRVRAIFGIRCMCLYIPINCVFVLVCIYSAM